MHKIYLVVDVDPDATLDISYALGAEGNIWTPAYTTTSGAGQTRTLRIPVIIKAGGPDDLYRLRFTGTGRVRIHRAVTEVTRRGN